jgi:phage gpG-like protein
VSITVVGDKEVIERFRALPERTRAALGDSVGRLALLLQRRVMQKLSGQVLNVKTGRLRRSIDQVVLRDEAQVVGVVSTNVKYARVHEYGFTGTVNVRDHLRQVKQAFGRPIAARAVMVKAHTRKANVPEKSFLRSALADMKPQIIEEMRRAAKAGMDS